MIQRKQTLYLLISAILMATFVFLPIAAINTAEHNYTFDILGLKTITNNECTTVLNIWPLTILFAVTALFNVAAIFMYKRRLQQARVTVLSMLLQAGMMVLMAFYVYYIFPQQLENTSLVFQFPAIIPVINIILTFMAYKGIKKDEAIIKSMDRIR